METESNLILHFNNVDKREVGLPSPNMEREGMIQCLDFLLSKGMKVAELITDSSSSVANTLGIYKAVSKLCESKCLITETKYPTVYHSRDVWHKAKKLKKALAEV